MKEIYIFSGLGADERVFKHLNIRGFDPVFIKWLQPLPGELLPQYSQRLLNQIEAKNPTLVGLSFGGIIAIEVSKLINIEQLILISSAKTKKEIPFYYRWGGFLNIHKLFPTRLLRKTSFVTNWLFGVKASEDKNILANTFRDTDPVFLKWAIDRIVKWNNADIPKNIKHIHGTSDKILPHRFIKADFLIKNGGHIMIVSNHSEVNQILEDLL